MEGSLVKLFLQIPSDKSGRLITLSHMSLLPLYMGLHVMHILRHVCTEMTKTHVCLSPPEVLYM